MGPNVWYPTRQQTPEKLVIRLWSDNGERISEALARTHETNQLSFETDSADLSFASRPA